MTAPARSSATGHEGRIFVIASDITAKSRTAHNKSRPSSNLERCNGEKETGHQGRRSFCGALACGRRTRVALDLSRIAAGETPRTAAQASA